MDDELISAEEAAKLLGVSRATIYNMVNRGIFHPYRITGLKRMKLYKSEVLGLLPEPASPKTERKTKKN